MKNLKNLIFVAIFLAVSACVNSGNHAKICTENVPVQTVVDAWNNRENLHQRFVRITGFLHRRENNHVLFSKETKLVGLNCIQPDDAETRGTLVFLEDKGPAQDIDDLPKKVTIAGFFVNESDQNETMLSNNTIIDNDRPCNGPLIDGVVIYKK